VNVAVYGQVDETPPSPPLLLAEPLELPPPSFLPPELLPPDEDAVPELLPELLLPELLDVPPELPPEPVAPVLLLLQPAKTVRMETPRAAPVIRRGRTMVGIPVVG
jgi:hypothetical protein